MAGIGNIIRIWLRNNGWTQAKLAEKLDVSSYLVAQQWMDPGKACGEVGCERICRAKMGSRKGPSQS